MIYNFEHGNKLFQGDICANLPMITPKQMGTSTMGRSNAHTTIWEEYTKLIKEGRSEAFEISAMPTPSLGIVLSQTCDIEHGENILFCRVSNLENWPEGLNNRTGRLKKIIRVETKKFYLPLPTTEKKLTNSEGPYYADFLMMFSLPAEMILQNLDVYWKARIIEPARKVFCEKIQRFFTRLSFDDILFFSNEEIIHYLKKEIITKDEIVRVLKEGGRENDIKLIIPQIKRNPKDKNNL